MGLGITWSLAVEEQFYAMLPLLIWLIDIRKLAAELSWRFFEKRFVDVGHQRKYLEKAQAAASTT